MPDFAYIARNSTGQKIQGTVVAISEREATSALAAQKLFPLQVTVADPKTLNVGAIKVKSKFVGPMFSQLAALLKSGVPMLRSIAVLRDQSSHEPMQRVLADVYTRVEEGATLAEAMARQPKAFNDLAVSVVRAGTEGGFLEDALDRIATFSEQQDELKGRVLGAMAYPCILGIAGFTILNILVIFFVPKFEKLFANLDARGELPTLTKVVIGLSEFMQTYGIFLLFGVLFLGWLIKRQLQTEAGRLWLDRWRMKIPQAGDIYLSFAVARFCRVLGTLLHGGVPIVRSLEISASSTGNKILEKTVAEAAENISSGESLAKPLGASGHFPKDVVEMIAVAEQSNSLEIVLPHIANSLEKSTWRKLDLGVRMLEPLMLLLMAGMVLVIVLALVMPMLKMSSTM